MSKKVIVVIEDDWELRGNGLGNVSHLQYLPSIYFMNLCEDLGVRMTFMVEVLQQLAFLDNQDSDRNLKIQARMWEENVLLMLDRGFDVQYHLHPQWHGAKYRDGLFWLNRKWNIASYDEETRSSIISRSFSYLNDLLTKSKSDHRITAFKAGGWALQPARRVLEDLADIGIKLIMGPRKNLVYRSEGFSVDYSDLEEVLMPYYPNHNDINRVSDREEPVVILPLTPYQYSASIKWNRLTQKLATMLGFSQAGTSLDRFYYHRNIPSEIKAIAPMVESASFTQKMFGTVHAHLNFENSIRENRIAIDQIMRNATECEDEIVPLVIETHTKGFEGKWDNVRNGLTYLVEKHGSMIEFQTTSEFVRTLESNPSMIRIKAT